jgi:high-affinity Fe2+/Pb2+ permease
MKLIIAKAVYYSSLALLTAGLITGVILVFYWLLSNPLAFQLFVSLIGLGLGFIAVGLAYGWSEKYLEKKKAYRND